VCWTTTKLGDRINERMGAKKRMMSRRAGKGSVTRRSKATLAGVVGAAAILAGCAITPKPLTDTERWSEAQNDRAAIFADQEPLTRPLTLQAAFERALKYNLDARVKVREQALAQDDLDLSRYDLLPKVGVNADFSTRSNVNAASDESILTGEQSLVPSTSTDRNNATANLTLSYNLLDFGVSYFNARQQADRTLIAEEQRRKVVQGLIQDVRRAYWRAASAQALNNRIVEAIRSAEAALPNAKKVETEGLHSPVDALRYQKALLDAIRRLEGAQQLLAASKTELASLINLPLGTPYSIAAPGGDSLRLGSPGAPITDMERVALLKNPEIREESYQVRISVDEAHKALVKLLPGVTLSYGPNYDSNHFLVHNYWSAGSAVLGGYLNNLITAPATFARTNDAQELAVLRREAVSMAVLAKLHIAYEQYLAAAKEYRRSSEVADVDDRLYHQIANRAATDVEGDLERISEQVSVVFSTLERDQSYAEAQAALGRLYATVGIDPQSGQAGILDIGRLVRAARKIAADQDATPQEASPGETRQSALTPLSSRIADAPNDAQGTADREASRAAKAPARPETVAAAESSEPSSSH
jgi:outer membrane protein, multidrug efflux system